ncbi:DNA polymerase III subunit chi [Candidatus Endoriftia persephonae]|jgi:DNA polymerase-3 subunit chi|uniref:DNA polymerase III subunit chi n=2 Tax=Gammaproteobacteria TaxID=1236 RepID=G2FC00_9GAMM|nr:DNA polymerase III subunit chi [Candidatus Endoriftia persephone]EGW55831.1 DNA polymerase III subunit chi [endosymbiont of Tevnia jerichonana (vent Tica)]USF86199.1 DNA polymerase III subunit chi [Candidatus Endoriftia persephone]
MTQVDFYILDDKARINRYSLACRLTEKIYHQGRRVFIHTVSADEARHMERLLWTFRQGSFIPHGLLGSADATTTPVIIGSSGDAGEEQDVLINLAPEVPNFFSRFSRVAELIDREPEVKRSGRERFRFYRNRGYPMNTHNIDL